jgi:hexokinase
MEKRLILSEADLMEVALLFKEKVEAGLNRDGEEIKAIPAFVRRVEPPEGTAAFAVDLGGSNLRAALVVFGKEGSRFERGPLVHAMPWKRNEPFPREAFLDIQADLLDALGDSEGAPLGYCFSYPARSTADGDAELIEWTKGIFVDGTRGVKVGRMLLDHLSARHGHTMIRSVRVVNDTIATLFAGLPGCEADAYIGLVVGTGSNMATFLDTAVIPKLRSAGDWFGPLPVNLESGNFHPPFLAPWDDEVDALSENPGEQRFEKAVSGLYLGRVLKAIVPAVGFDPSTGAAGLVHLMDREACSGARTVVMARQVYDRSATLVAAELAGLTALINARQHLRTLCIVAEGGLFWSRPRLGPRYAAVVETAFAGLIHRLGMGHLVVNFTEVRDATLTGSALAALG